MSRHAVYFHRDDSGIRHMVFVMYHATRPDAALDIIDDGMRFRPSKNGLLGPGVYASHTYEKAYQHGVGNFGYDEFVVFKLLVYVGKVKT